MMSTKFKYAMLHIVLPLLIWSCSGTETVSTDEITEDRPDSFPEECSQYYLYKDHFIDLETLKESEDQLEIDQHFKTCSKYAYRFEEKSFDTLYVDGKKIYNHRLDDDGIYEVHIQSKRETNVIKAPVNEPLAEVQEYYMELIPSSKGFILVLWDTYDVFFRLVQYDINGNELERIDIERTYVTIEDGNVHHHHEYLYFHEITKNEIVFTSHMAFADTFKTVIVDRTDLSVKTYDRMSHGIILNEDETNVAGFVTTDKDYDKQLTTYNIFMLDGEEYKFQLKYGSKACNFALRDSLLYIGTYHPISTGSDLHCFDLAKNEMKWDANVLQLNVGHSEYYNAIEVTLYKDKVILEGFEAYGHYLQIFDAYTGERLASFDVGFPIKD